MPQQVIADDNNYLALTVLITVFYQLSFFLIAATYKFDKVTDFAGGTNFVILAAITYSLGSFPNPCFRQTAVTIIIILWGLRLSGFLLFRILMIGEDHRFDAIRDKPLQFLFFWVFQMLWVWIVSLPVTYVNSTAKVQFEVTDAVGIILATIGLIIEAWSDQSKFYFRQDKSNKDQFCNVGLWKYSRHPNYFGELLFWWSIFLVCSQTFKQQPYAYFTIASPLFITSLLFGLSGLPILESSANSRFSGREDYIKYRQQTSILIPLPNCFYSALPTVVKAVLLFEWPIFAAGFQQSVQSVKIHTASNSPTAAAADGATMGNDTKSALISDEEPYQQA